MRPSLLIAFLLSLAFGTGQALRSLPHTCDAAHAPHEQSPGTNGELHAHCEVCDFSALPFDHAPVQAQVITPSPCGELGASAIEAVLVRLASLHAGRGPPAA